ncbi:MAG: hypothetical protein ACXW33_01030 [Sulfuricurvum sp.]
MLNFSDSTQILRSLCQKYPFLRRFLCRPVSLVYADDAPAQFPQNAVLILSPRNYWAIQATLNVKTQKEAAAFGSALFDLGHEYQYEAKRIKKNSYSLIAYNPTEISLIVQSFPNPEMIERITFAQWVFADESRPIRLGNGKVLTVAEGVVIEIDPDYLGASDAIFMREALREPRFFIKTIPVERLLTPDITSKTLKMTLIILLIVLGNLIVSAVFNSRESAHLEERKQSLLTQANLPETSIEREAILASLRKKEAGQLNVRDQFFRISLLPIKASPAPNSADAGTPFQQTPPVPAAPSGGVVLIPGSAPGEPNRLLVGGTSNAASPEMTFQENGGNGIKEVVYDGNNIKMIVTVKESEAKEKLKKAVKKQFKKAKFSESGNQLEVRIP